MTSPALVEVAEPASGSPARRRRTGSTPPGRQRTREPPGAIDPRRGIRGERIDLMDIGVERADLLFVRRVRRTGQRKRSFPPKPASRARTWRLGYSATRANLRCVFDGAGSAGRGQNAAEAGEVPKPVGELGFEVRAAGIPGDIVSSR